MEKAKTYYIIDFSNWVYRFKSVYPFAKVESSGVMTDTSVLFGFARILPLLPYKDIIIVLDGIPTISKSILPGYKGQRLHDDQKEGTSISHVELVTWLSNVGRVINKNISVVCSPCQETDEVIASIVYQAIDKLPKNYKFVAMLHSKPITEDRVLAKYESLATSNLVVEPNSKCVIASTDGDFLQLQRFLGVYIDLSLTGKDVSNKHTSKSTDGLNPLQTILYKTVFGDVSDNIPSVPTTPKQKQQVKDYIKSVLSEEQLNKCLNNIWNSPTNEVEAFLYGYRRITKINYEVAHLEFRGYPLLLYKECDPFNLLNKYKVRMRCPKNL